MGVGAEEPYDLGKGIGRTVIRVPSEVSVSVAAKSCK